MTPHPNPLLKERDNTCFQSENGNIIFSNIIDGSKKSLKNFTLTSLSKRADILDSAISKIEELFKSGVKPSEISIITPLQDDMLRFTLKENLKKCNLVFLSGSEKLIDNALVKSSLSILKLMLNLDVHDFDLRVLFSDFVGIPIKYSKKIFETYKSSKTLPSEIENYNEKYQKFYTAFNEIKTRELKLSAIVYEMFYKTVDIVDENKINKFK